MYNTELARKILEALYQAFPQRLDFRQLRQAMPEFSALTEDEWLLAIDALNKDGLVEGILSRLGFNKVLRKVGPIEITSLGRTEIRHGVAEAGSEPVGRDDLLGICSRGQFDTDLVDFSDDASQDNPLALVMADIDDFKAVNDTYGHPTGDEVLKKVASVFATSTDGKGRCYRYGGDEFAVLLPNYTQAEAACLAERISAKIAGIRLEGGPEVVTVSLGVASFPETSEEVSALLSDADKAMYSAKRGGENRVCTTGIVSQYEKSTRTLSSLRMRIYLEQGHADNFLMTFRNNSDEEIQIEEIRLEKDGILLTEPARLPSPDLWKVPAGSAQSFGWKATPDPAVSLLRMNPNEGVTFQTTIDVIAVCRLQASRAEFKQKLFVKVEASRRTISQLAG